MFYSAFSNVLSFITTFFFSSPCRCTVGSVNDSQIFVSINISVETTTSTHQNQVCAPIPVSNE
jgi:hypothetical protein